MRDVLTASDGTAFRDLDHDGRMAPYEDSRCPVEERVEDLLARLSTEEKAGLMFHTVIEAGPNGEFLSGPGRISKSGTEQAVRGKLLNHFNVHELRSARQAATWANNVQALAAQTPHGIPVTISTDPRHGYVENAGASFAATFMSQWPEPIGLGALASPQRVEEFARIVRTEYCAIGVRAALHPTADLATEPRWARQVGTFGQDPETVAELTVAYLRGLQGERAGRDWVAACTKHFPGGGPQKDGEDAHFPYGKDQVYPGGHFEDHLAPFRAAISAGTAAIMPYYGRPIGLERNGVRVEEVGFGFNRQIVTDLLRGELGYDGVILTDWELVTDNVVGDQVLPARAWGVEHLGPEGRMSRILDAGADQFGGEECVDVLLGLVRDGRVPLARLDESARRLLRVKFELGLFDDPFVDIDLAASAVGREEFRAAGHRAMAESTVILKNDGILPIRPAQRVYTEGIPADERALFGSPVERPEDADLAIVRLAAPWEPRGDLFLESWFHQGSLAFGPGLGHRLERIADCCPVVLDVRCDRPAILTDLLGAVSALTIGFGSSAAAYADAISGRISPLGRLPFDLPASMESVRHGREDVPGSTLDPLFRCGDGLGIQGVL